MAEIYPLGNNRIFYRPQGFIEGLSISVQMIDPDFIKFDHIDLTEFEDGLYYFDFEFIKEGTYIGIFRENGNKRTSQAFSTRKIPAKAYIRGGSGNLLNRIG